jgi:hypothetical protein
VVWCAKLDASEGTEPTLVLDKNLHSCRTQTIVSLKHIRNVCGRVIGCEEVEAEYRREPVGFIFCIYLLSCM